MSSEEHEKALQRKIEQLEIALMVAQQRLAQYEAIHDMAVGFVVGNIVSSPDARPILVSSKYHNKDTIFAVMPQDTSLPIEQGGKYIFAGECDGQWNRSCKTHHMILRAEHIFPTTFSPGAIPSREQLGMFMLSKFVDMYSHEK